ncbi:MAG: hypothetical protein ACLR71_00070 [[Clostridium] scindens]
MKLIKIISDKVQIKTDQTEFKEVRINDLLSISDGRHELVTCVTSITDTDISDPFADEDFIAERLSVKVVECSIIGSILNGRFSSAIEQYPSTDIVAREIDRKPSSGCCRSIRTRGSALAGMRHTNVPPGSMEISFSRGMPAL